MHAATAVKVWLAGAILFGSSSTRLPPQDAVALLRRVDAHYDRLKTLRTRYIEHYTGMGMDRSEAGTLLIARPGRMRWNYDRPPGKVYVVDGKYGWSYVPGDVQVQRTPAKKLDDLRSPLRFLLGRSHLAKELAGVSVDAVGEAFRISGIPRGMEARVRLLVIDVDGTGVIHRLRLEELDGAVTEFTFSGIVEDAPIAAKVFTFAAPPGVSVVEGLPPI